MEHGATWLPSWLHTMDFAGGALRKFQKLEHLPSDLVRRHLKFAPFAGEPVGWIIDQVGPELLVYASDYPHPEGTSDPIGKFERTMTECDEATMSAFYFDNMAELMGVT
jgi:predicted TIM-barrel fold metal-dependent hydrolase